MNLQYFFFFLDMTVRGIFEDLNHFSLCISVDIRLAVWGMETDGCLVSVRLMQQVRSRAWGFMVHSHPHTHTQAAWNTASMICWPLPPFLLHLKKFSRKGFSASWQQSRKQRGESFFCAFLSFWHYLLGNGPAYQNKVLNVLPAADSPFMQTWHKH